jgi:hypothetical protein
MARRDETPKTDQITWSEELDANLHKVVEMLLDAGARADDIVARRIGSEPADETEERPPRSDEKTFRALRDYLQDELVVVSELEAGEGIVASERDHEIAKRALATLKLPELRRTAESFGLPKKGNRDAILDRLVRYLEADHQEIARVLLRADRYPHIGRQHASRLFAFDSLVDAPTLASKLNAYAGRYLRTGLAQWFVFEQTVLDGSEFRVDGKLRTYEVDVLAESASSPRLNPVPKDFDVLLRVLDGEPVIRVVARYEAETEAAVSAMTYAVERGPIAPLEKFAAAADWTETGRFSPQTIWLLDVLLTLRDDSDVALEQVTSASFERARSDGGTALDPSVPHVRSAKLRGQHVLDSQSACRHVMALERLRAVTALVSFPGEGGGRDRLPVRLVVEKDHIGVMTGFGSAGHEHAERHHRMLEDLIASRVSVPQLDRDRLVSILEQMRERAEATDAPTEADLFVSVAGGEIEVSR